MEKKTSADSSPGSTTTETRKTSLADVKRRLEAEKKRLANIRKSRNESKVASPKVALPLKRKAERRSTESEVKKKKIESPVKSSSSSSVGETVTPKKKSSPAKKSPPKSSPVPEAEKEEENVSEPKVDTQEKPAAKPAIEVKEAEEKEEEDSEDKIPLAALKNSQKETKPEAGPCGLPPDTEYTIGYKLEAKDFNEDWYPARVVEVDYDDREVLVHFERWSSRYDEWINMDSPRLRPPGPLSNGNTKQSKGPVKQKSSIPKTPLSAEPSPPEKPTTPVLVPPVTTLVSSPAPVRTFKVDDHVMASWSDSRKYPAKITGVLENDMYKVLFFDGFTKVIKGTRISPGLRPGTQVDPLAPVEPPPPPTSVYPPEEDIGSKADRRERKRKINVCELFSMKRRTSPSKPSSSTPSSTPTSANKTPSSPSKLANKPAASPADTPLPPKRSKTKTFKMQSPGHEDLLLIKTLSSPQSGETSKAKASGVAPVAGSELRRVRTLLPRAKFGSESTAASDPPPPHNSCTRSPLTPVEQPPPPPASILEGMQIEMEDGNFKCPSEGCGKLYRKENLLQMHIKHYHPELKSRLMVVPKVMELAYARTISDLPSTAVAHRNTSSSALSSSNASVTPASSQRKSLAPQSVPKKTTKAVEKPEVDATSAEKLAQTEPQPSPSIALPLSTPAKTGQIKMLLPVNRSSVKNDSAKTDNASTGQQPLSALQQALMSPPGALSAMLHTSPTKTPTATDSRPKLSVKPELKPVFHSPTRSRSGSPRGGRLRDEKSPNKELVNCMCGVPEEDGLMIQCDLCMCWQHGLCNMIETEEQVPEKYVCHICLHPSKERLSRKYAHDQDWLKEGTLPRMPIRRNQGRVVRSSTEELLKETHDITATITRLQDVIHSLQVKINIAEKADHPKLYLWSKQWETEEFKPLFSKPEEAKPLDEELKPKPDSQASDDSDLHPALKMPLTQSELDHLASTVEHKLLSTDDGNTSTITPTPEVKAPEPEAPIQPAACRLVLLEHIEKLQAQLEARLEELEARADALESKDPDLFGDNGDSSPSTKETMRMLQRDLGAVTKISNYATSD